MPEGSCCGWPFNEALVILHVVTTLSNAFPCLELLPVRACAAGVELSVSLFVRHFFACSRLQDTFKSFLYSKQVDQVKKVSCMWSTIDRYGLEARKTLLLTRG